MIVYGFFFFTSGNDVGRFFKLGRVVVKLYGFLGKFENGSFFGLI